MSHAKKTDDRPADVVTAFLWDGRRILLALRSPSVSTFPGHWAGISGYLEGDDPLAWALVEITEECDVDRTHLTPMGAAPPLDVPDDHGRPAFRVHPFLVQIDDPARVRHDWESQRFEWIEVAAIKAREKQPAVPQLYEAFESVWPPWPVEQAIAKNCNIAVSRLRHDRTMGAGQLARAAAGELVKLIRLAAGEDDATHRPRLRDAILALQAARPSMAAPANMMADVLADFERQQPFAQFLSAVQDRIAQAAAAEQQVAARMAEQLPDRCRVMTISYSGTVHEALKLAAARLRHVYVCEGRPLSEGRRLAAALAQATIPVTLLTDAQAFSLMPQIDCVVIGADAVLHNHDVVNKAGSGLVALAARHFDKPFRVAAASLKWERTPGTVVVDEDNPPEEVWDDAPPHVTISNRYFDRVPRALITQWIDETGPRSI